MAVEERDEPVVFTLAGAVAGLRLGFPVAVSVLAYGLAFGVFARQAGLSLGEALLMSVAVCAGSSQFVALQMWTMPLPTPAIIFTTLVVNLRHLLMGASLRPWFARVPPLAAYGSAHVLNDESWALTMGEFAAGRQDRAFLLGSGLATGGAWVIATGAGHALGTSFPDPARWGLDFAFTAVFVALLTGMWKGKSDLFPWAVAAAVAVLAARWLPGKWYILLGGLAGSVAGAARDRATVAVASDAD